MYLFRLSYEELRMMIFKVVSFPFFLEDFRFKALKSDVSKFNNFKIAFETVLLIHSHETP